MKYIDAEKLKEKIDEVRQDWLGDSTGLEVAERGAELGAAESILNSVDDIIYSLQKEQPEVDLEKEIDSCWQAWISPSNQSSVEGVLPKSEFSMYARHFYELAKNSK